MDYTKGMTQAQKREFYGSCEWGVHQIAVQDTTTKMIGCPRCRRVFC